MTISISTEIRTKVSSVLFERFVYINIQGKAKIPKKVGKCSALETDNRPLGMAWMNCTEGVNYPSDLQH